MKLTKTQKDAIRSHWANSYIICFKKDGTVMGKTSRNGPYGVLYTPHETESHLKAVGLL